MVISRWAMYMYMYMHIRGWTYWSTQHGDRQACSLGICSLHMYMYMYMYMYVHMYMYMWAPSACTLRMLLRHRPNESPSRATCTHRWVHTDCTTWTHAHAHTHAQAHAQAHAMPIPMPKPMPTPTPMSSPTPRFNLLHQRYTPKCPPYAPHPRP